MNSLLLASLAAAALVGGAVAVGLGLAGPVPVVGALIALGLLAWMLIWMYSTDLLKFSAFSVVVLHGMSVIRDSHFSFLDFTREARVPLTVLVLIFLMGGRPIGLLSNPGWAAASGPLAFVSWAFLGGLFASDPSTSVFYSLWLGVNVVIIALLIAASSDPGEAWRRFVGMDKYMALLLVVISLLLIAAGDPQARGTRWLGETQVPGYVGLFIGPNWFAFVGVLTVALWLAHREYEPVGSSPIPLRVVMAICALAVLLTTARTGFLGVGLGLIFHIRDDLRRISIRRIVTALPGIVILVAILAVLVSQTAAGQAVIGRFLTTDNPGEVAGTGRLRIWWAFLVMYVQNPLFGVGFFTTIPRDEFELVRNLGEAKDPHSTVIALFFTTGFVGTLLLTSCIVGAFRGVRHPGAGAFRRSAAAFLVTTGPYFLLETVASGPGSPASWPLWFVLLCARGWNGLPRRAGGAGEWNPLDHAVALPRTLPEFEPGPRPSGPEMLR